MKYKVGDIVKIRDDLIVGRVYGEIEYELYHERYKIVHIVEECGYYYFVEENRLPYTDEMIERLATRINGI